MNLRHVNSVSQSYIGNTALRYTPNKDGLLKARVPVPAAGEPPSPRCCLLPATAREARRGARQNLLGTRGIPARSFSRGGKRRNAAGARARSLPSGRPNPEGSPRCRGAAKNNS